MNVTRMKIEVKPTYETVSFGDLPVGAVFEDANSYYLKIGDTVGFNSVILNLSHSSRLRTFDANVLVIPRQATLTIFGNQHSEVKCD